MPGASLGLTQFKRQSVAPLKSVRQVQFGVLSPEQLRDLSVVEVSEVSTYDESGTPKPHGLNDLRMGTTIKGLRCQTCLEESDVCPGHFGHIVLSKPVYHIGFLSVVLKVLRSVCHRCSKLKVDLNDPAVRRAQDFPSKTRLDRICELARVKERCEGGDDIADDIRTGQATTHASHGGCGALQPKYTVDSLKVVMEEIDEDAPATEGQKPRKKTKLSAEAAHKILRRISDEDLALMGFNTAYVRPDWMILNLFPVPPPAVRPSIVLDDVHSEDDLTYKLADILKTNATIKKHESQGLAQHIIDEGVALLQYHCATFFNNTLASVPQATQRGGRPLKSLRQRLHGKEGRIRGNLMGKRTDFSARTVITPDPNLRVDQLGVPRSIAMELTFPERVTRHNVSWLRRLVANGPDEHPGANYIVMPDGQRFDLRYARDAVELQEGFIVERHLIDGDLVIFNRQPSLHKMSMMGHEIKVLPFSTFRLNLSVTPPYNADFDGDEMNMFVPQSQESRAEIREIMAVQRQMVSPQGNSPVMGLVQDSLLACRQFTRRSVFLEADMVMNLLMWIPNGVGRIPEPAILKPRPLWTGKQIISLIIPKSADRPGINLLGFSSVHPDGEKDLISPGDTQVLIENGRLICGILDKKVLGAAQGGLVHALWLEQGSQAAASFINLSQQVVNYWILHTGFTIGIADTIADAVTIDAVQETIAQAKGQVKQLVERAQKGLLELQAGRTAVESFETRVNQVLNFARDESGKLAQQSLTPKNNVKCTVDSGSKGSFINISQMMACVGQQNVEGKRIPFGFRRRTLPHFTKDDNGPESRGFVENSYLRGLTPQEFFFHAMGGREGLVDTAVKTSQTGYTQRRLVKAMESVSCKYDGTVRNAAGQIIQFLYGEDGMDGSRVEKQLLHSLRLSDSEMRSLYYLDPLSDDYGHGWMLPADIKKIQSSLFFRRMHEEEFEQLIRDRDLLRRLFPDGDKSWPLPVHMERLVWAARKHFSVADKSLTPTFVIHNVRKTLESIFIVRGSSQVINKAAQDARTLFSILVRSVLSAKRCCCEYKLSKEGFVWCLGELRTRFVKSLVAPGEMVGPIAAQSVGERVTQMTLNTFHYAGVSAKNVTLGVPRLTELINVSANPKTPGLTVPLRSSIRMDSDAAKAVQCTLQHTTLQMVADLSEVIYDPDPRNTVVDEDRVWVTSYYELPDDDTPDPDTISPWLLRIVLNNDMMVDKKLSIGEIQRQIRQEFQDGVYCICSDDNALKLVLRIRLAPDDTGNADDGLSDQTDDQFLQMLEQRVLMPMTLQGIPEIRRVFMKQMKQTTWRDDGAMDTVSPWVLDTEGTNLRMVMTHPQVDFSRVTTNDVVEALHVLGIEGARQTLMNELRNVISFDGSYVNYRHVSLLVDTMTRSGSLMAISRHGINRTDAGALMKCSFEQTTEILLEAAAFGERDYMRGVTENVMLGNLAPMGTGDFEILMDLEALKSVHGAAGDQILLPDGEGELAETPWAAGSPGVFAGFAEHSPFDRVAVFSPVFASPAVHGGEMVPAYGQNTPNPMSPQYHKGLVNPTSPLYGGGSPASPQYDQGLSPASPQYSPASPQYSPASPQYSPASPQYSPASPQYSPASPQYSPASPQYSPASPQYSPASPQYSPASPQYSPASPQYSPASPKYSPSSPHTGMSPSSPQYSPTSPQAYSPASPQYSPASPKYSPTSPQYSSAKTHHSPTSPMFGNPQYSPVASPAASPTSPNYSPPMSPDGTSPAYHQPHSPTGSVASSKVSARHFGTHQYSPSHSSAMAPDTLASSRYSPSERDADDAMSDSKFSQFGSIYMGRCIVCEDLLSDALKVAPSDVLNSSSGFPVQCTLCSFGFSSEGCQKKWKMQHHGQVHVCKY